MDFDVHGFCRSTREGVFAGGMLRGPLDIPETVVDTARVAAEVAMYLGPVAPPALPYTDGKRTKAHCETDRKRQATPTPPWTGKRCIHREPPRPATAWTELWMSLRG